MADPAAEREAANAGCRDNACWNRKTECVRRMVYISPQRSTSYQHSALLRVYADIFYR
jgi:hypothetical protein